MNLVTFVKRERRDIPAERQLASSELNQRKAPRQADELRPTQITGSLC
jgi:hypothetical protein